MIRETLDSERRTVVTSDHWHVVHAEWSGGPGTPHFTRRIVSEHEDSASALIAARALKAGLVRAMGKRAAEARDQVMVRRPGSESLSSAGRLERMRS